MNQPTAPFAGLFRLDTGLRGFRGGPRWSFAAGDTAQSAKAMLAHLDRLFQFLVKPGCVFLSTIELDAEPGLFPEVLLQYFWD